jgi:NAD/NADP transhydrogenase beta subunit
MNVIVDYFGLFIFAFVVFVGGLVVLPEVTEAPQTSLREMLGLALAFVVITGGFSWYYFAAASPEELGGEDETTARGRSL